MKKTEHQIKYLSTIVNKINIQDQKYFILKWWLSDWDKRVDNSASTSGKGQNADFLNIC